MHVESRFFHDPVHDFIACVTGIDIHVRAVCSVGKLRLIERCYAVLET
jgi:hypothetical protein